jgi:hypothetical protein
MAINEEAVHGETDTGYQDPKAGPFRCSNCKYFNASTDGCSGKSMKKLSQRKKLPSGDVLVDANGHCVYFESKGRE